MDVAGVGIEAAAARNDVRSPETYLGAARGERRTNPGALKLNQWALTANWTTGGERVVLDAPGGSIAYRFHARDANLVLSPGPRAPIPFRLLLDGEAPGAAHGLDVDAAGHGLLDEGRLYQLVRQPDPVRDRTLELTFDATGAEAYVFTFG